MGDYELTPESAELLEYILAKVENIPSLPIILSRIMVMLDDPEAKIADLQYLIAQDVSLTTNVLKIANSAYYGFSGRIKTISQAIIILGFRTIRSLVFAASAYNILKGEVSGYGYKSEELWKHSVINGLLSRELSQRFGVEDPEVAFITGLLHDVGKLVLAPIVEEHIQTIKTIIEDKGLEFYQAERHVFGFDHGILGSRLLQKWGLPALYVQVVRDHHSPVFESEYFKEICFVHIANYICYKLNVVSPFEKNVKIGSYILRNLGMSTSDVQRIYTKGKEILSDWEKSFEFLK
ncbi:MAG: HDOD domain-containing protein [Candidatus Hydrogenedentota bacterium]